MIFKRKREVWRSQPLVWLEERFGEKATDFQWSAFCKQYMTHVWDGDVDPIANAWKDIANKKWVSVKAATGTSKTYWLARLVYWFLDCYEDGLVVTTAPAETQLKINLWGEISKSFDKFQKIRPYAYMTSLGLKPEFHNPDIPYWNSYMATGLVAGVKAGEESATKAQGYHRKNMLIICEEAAGMSPAVMTALQNTSTGDNNIIVVVGNPDSENDQLHQFAILPNVNAYRISAYDYPNVVLKNSDLFAGAVSEVSIERRRLKYSEESPLYKSRVRGLTPSGSSDTLIRRDWIKRIIVDETPKYDLAVYNAVGVDVANSELGDKASLVWGTHNVIDLVQEFQCPDASHLGYNLFMASMELAQNGYTDFGTPTIQERQISAECIGLDVVGVGVSTLNVLDNNGLTPYGLSGGQLEAVIPVDYEEKRLYNFGSLRDQMYWELREDIRTQQIFICIDDPKMLQQLIEELSTAKFILNDNKVVIEGKAQIKKRLGGKSPNVADGVAYWNWARKGYKFAGGYAAILGGTSD